MVSSYCQLKDEYTTCAYVRELIVYLIDIHSVNQNQVK